MDDEQQKLIPERIGVGLSLVCRGFAAHFPCSASSLCAPLW
jgi:hypothetical protein